MDVLRHYDVAEDFELVLLAGGFERVEEDVPCRCRVEEWIAVVTTEGDEVVVAFLLVTLQVERHGWIVVGGPTGGIFVVGGVKAVELRSMPTLGAMKLRRRWGTPVWWRFTHLSDDETVAKMGHPAVVG